MEDGKKRHLYQLQSKKQQIKINLPDQNLNQHLQYMKSVIKGYSFPKSLFQCCLRKKSTKVNHNFSQAFEQLPIQDQIYYYRKYLDCSLSISKKTTKFPQTAQYLEDHQIKYDEKQSWKATSVKLDPNSKILDAAEFKIDLHHAFLTPNYKMLTQSQLVIIPWNSNLKGMQIKSQTEEQNNLFQRIELIWYAALEQNIVNMIQGLELAPVEQNQNGLESERSINQRLVRQTLDIPIPPAVLAVREVSLVNHLNYKHPVESLPPPLAPNRLRRTTGMHYYFQGQYQINKDGELVVTNKQKLQAQGSVMKFIIKKIFSGGSIFSISLPVTVFGQESNLSLLLNSYRHAPIELDQAALQSNALKRFLKVVRFSLTCPACYIRCDKPFNPILGETYQALVENTLFYGQQISHHPPISSIFIKGRGYTMYGNLQAQINFGLNSAVGNNKGWLNISFDPQNIHKKVVRFNNIPGQMTGMVLGSRKLNLKGNMYIVDEQNLLFCKMSIGQIKIQKKVKAYKDSVEGMIVKLKSGTNVKDAELINQNDVQSQLGLISGRWLSDVFFKGNLLINTTDQPPPQVQRYPALLPSDYSIREDIIQKRKGDNEASQKAKQKLQDLQRNDRKLRQKDTYRRSMT